MTTHPVPINGRLSDAKLLNALRAAADEYREAKDANDKAASALAKMRGTDDTAPDVNDDWFTTWNRLEQATYAFITAALAAVDGDTARAADAEASRTIPAEALPEERGGWR